MDNALARCTPGRYRSPDCGNCGSRAKLGTKFANASYPSESVVERRTNCFAVILDFIEGEINTMQKVGLVFLAVLGTLPSFGRQTFPLSSVAQSHIEGNVPAPADFDRFLKRDLTAYFTKQSGKSVSVNYEYLRKGPTQSGVAFPKYYVWVRIYRNKLLSSEGAVRVAAINRTHFDITDYLSKAQIRKGAQPIEAVFPPPVCAEIRKHL